MWPPPLPRGTTSEGSNVDKFLKGLTSAINAEGLGFFLGIFIILVILALVEWRPEDVAARISGDTTTTG